MQQTFSCWLLAVIIFCCATCCNNYFSFVSCCPCSNCLSCCPTQPFPISSQIFPCIFSSFTFAAFKQFPFYRSQTSNILACYSYELFLFALFLRAIFLRDLVLFILFLCALFPYDILVRAPLHDIYVRTVQRFSRFALSPYYFGAHT